MSKIKWLVPTIYIVFLMLPIYWLLNMSFKTTTEIINVYSLWPKDFTLINYKTILQMLEEIKVMFPEDYKKILRDLELNKKSD